MIFPNVERDYQGGSAQVRQGRFLLTPDTDTGDSNETSPYTWWVPVSFTSPRLGFQDTSPSCWLDPAQAEIYPAFSLAVYNRIFLCMESIYSYVIKNQRGASKIPLVGGILRSKAPSRELWMPELVLYDCWRSNTKNAYYRTFQCMKIFHHSKALDQ